MAIWRRFAPPQADFTANRDEPMASYGKKLASLINRSWPRPVFRERAEGVRALIRPRDVVVAAILAVGIPVASLLPVRLLIRLARALAGVGGLLLDQSASAAHVADAGGYSVEFAREITRRARRERITSLALFLRCVLRRPPYEIWVEGTENLEAARVEGNGAVLWVADLVHCGDVSKIALRDKGYMVSHLSRPEHGFSDTRFGLKFLNPVRTNFELRYLRERVVHERARPGEAVATLIERLKENGVVSVLASAYEGRRLLEVRVLEGRIEIAGGAPKAAFRAGAPILPVFVLPAPEAPDFRVIVGHPLALSGADEKQAIASATADFAARLEGHVRTYPQLWRGWSFLRPLREEDKPLSNRARRLAGIGAEQHGAQ